MAVQVLHKLVPPWAPVRGLSGQMETDFLEGDLAVTRNGYQIERMSALLRDVQRSGGVDRWSHLHSHGHKFATVQSAVARGYLIETLAYHYKLADDAAAFFTWHALWSKVKND